MSERRNRTGSLFETGADHLLKVLRKKGRMPISKAAFELGLSDEAVEDWATDFQLYSDVIHIEVVGSTKYLVINKKKA